MKEIRIGTNDSGQRLDKFLFKLFKTASSGMIYKWLRKKRVKINGKREENSYMLNEGDVISLYVNDEFFPSDFNDESFLKSSSDKKINKSDKDSAALSLKNKGVEIVYNDNNIILINKKSGINSHGGENSALSITIDYLKETGEYKKNESLTFTPSLCNRIDRNTEGIVIIAKNAAALREMNERIKNREIHKFYLLKAEGSFKQKEGVIEGYLLNDEALNRTSFHKTKVKGSKYSMTKYRVLSEKNGESTVEAELVTGRKHQIRVHFSAIGHPLIGDVKYGAKKNGSKSYQRLCAYKLEFDFKEKGILSYLDKKSFSVKPKSI